MTSSEDILARVQRDLQMADAKVSKIEAELAAARAEMADLQGFVRTFERYAGGAQSASVATERAEPRKNKDRGIPEEGTQGRKLVDTCIDAIQAKGAPVKIGDLLDIVLATGLTLGGSDQKSNLAGYLSRDPRTVSRGRSIGWDVAKTEEAALEPDSEEAASSNDTGGTNDSPTLALPDDDPLYR